ncbi:MAG: hypothetical protein GWO00_01600, partial [Gemmatimonadetes bacterium]|nr:hypothetical protein [Gemmatimonadota bacterium]NIR77123.1 hypothetical protein [Gemmatimonadota bacterium]NIT85641.1 hypothetical protein [Gemmatimonadota bacterium]NIU29473.1 hypothetical protein [Gemmatimonadota bacterium]NIV59889.1 hypothetical protein [Gemmatimonadota bacterium]
MPRAFPETDAEGAVVAGATAEGSHEAAHDLLESGIAEVQERFGVTRALADLGWIMRGGRAWFHRLTEWPLRAWPTGDWRPISVGIRALEFDSKGRA